MPMKVIKSIFVFLILMLLIGICGLLYIDWLETPKSYFNNYNEMEKSGIMSRGWVPTFIPVSAINIYEQHSIDSNWVEMKFEYDPSDIQSTRKACDSEIPIEKGIQFFCTYFGSSTEIKLYENGEGTLHTPVN